MKKLLMIFASVLIAVSVAACSPTSEDNGNTTESADAGVTSEDTDESGDILKVGLIQYVDHTSLNIIRDNFISHLAELGYDESKIQIDYQNAQADMSNINSICQKFVGDDVDMIAAIATPAAQGAAAAAAGTDIPVVFIAVSDPVRAGLVDDLENPGGNITGCSDVVPVDQIIELAEALTPGVQKYGFIYNMSEANSLTFIASAKEYCEENNIEYVEATVTNGSEVQQAAQSLVGQVDAIICPNDNTVAASMHALAQVANEADIPVYAGAVTMVMDGALASVGVDSAEIGILGADVAAEVLSGKPAGEVPVVVVKKYNAKVNQDTADAIGVDVTGYEAVDPNSDTE